MWNRQCDVDEDNLDLTILSNLVSEILSIKVDEDNLDLTILSNACHHFLLIASDEDNLDLTILSNSNTIETFTMAMKII